MDPPIAASSTTKTQATTAALKDSLSASDVQKKQSPLNSEDIHINDFGGTTSENIEVGASVHKSVKLSLRRDIHAKDFGGTTSENIEVSPNDKVVKPSVQGDLHANEIGGTVSSNAESSDDESVKSSN